MKHYLIAWTPFSPRLSRLKVPAAKSPPGKPPLVSMKVMMMMMTTTMMMVSSFLHLQNSTPNKRRRPGETLGIPVTDKRFYYHAIRLSECSRGKILEDYKLPLPLPLHRTEGSLNPCPLTVSYMQIVEQASYHAGDGGKERLRGERAERMLGASSPVSSRFLLAPMSSNLRRCLSSSARLSSKELFAVKLYLHPELAVGNVFCARFEPVPERGPPLAPFW